MADYRFQEIEKKWQKSWKESELYKVSNISDKPKYYILDMFPYPSGAGLHVGHPLGYIASDIVARYKRLKGFNVLHPMGFDSFGLPAEQYAITTGQHPKKTTAINIDGCFYQEVNGDLKVKPEFIEKDGYIKKEALLPGSKERKINSEDCEVLRHVIKGYKLQLEQLGLSYDWSREIRTSDPKFYQWTQWIFKLIYNSWYNTDSDTAEPIESLISILEKEGNAPINAVCDEETPAISTNDWNAFSKKEKEQFLLKYRLTYLAETTVNWCAALGTVLSNDEVKDGFSERGGHPVVKKKMPQWNMRITAYCDRLLKGLDTIDWPEPIKEMQRNWIGKSTGCQVRFALSPSPEEKRAGVKEITTFTTRIDTLFGATFLVLSPEHERVKQLTTTDQKTEVEAYVKEAINRSERERMSDVKTVSGVFSGRYVINPFTHKQIPVWIADYVLVGYGTGAVMAVPAHDERDHRFAKKFGLKIVQVIDGNTDVQKEAFTSKNAKVINSNFMNGLTINEAIQKGTDFAVENGFGEAKINFRLRDAIFGRQRYWGEPIPIYYKEGVPHLVEDDSLPLELPPVNEYLPTEDGNPPLGRAKDWNHSGDSYELSTMPGWAGSSWYFFRYMDPNNEKEFASKEVMDYWQEVDFYMGGSEHATGHLLYSRFWTKFLYDLGYVKIEEYAKKLVNQGMIQGESRFVYRGNKKPNIYIPFDRIEGEWSQKEWEEFGIRDSGDLGLITSYHVDISLVDKNGFLDIKAFKNSRKENNEATFLLDKEGRYPCNSMVEKMSKSKYNVVNPDGLVEKYGADTLRMYELFLGPIEQSKPWNTNGIEGVFKFLRKFWKLFHENEYFKVSNEEPSKKELKTLHGLIKKVEYDCEHLSLNTSVSAFMIAVNELGSLTCNKRTILEPITILLSPFAPHIAEELWSQMGHETSVVDTPFPLWDEKHLTEDSHEYPVSINGKIRVKLSFGLDMSKEHIEREVLANKTVQKWTEGKPPKRVIVVPKRIVNVVV